MKFAPYSFSRISTYQQCPRKFKYKYVDGADKEPVNLQPVLKGGCIHHILEHYPKQSTHKLQPQYQHIVDKFLSTNLGKRLMFRESTREYDFGLTEELEPCAYSNDAMFRGSVDYLYFDEDVLHLIDWKSGKHRDLRWQSFDQLMFYAVYFFIKFSKLQKIHVHYVYVEHDTLPNSLPMDRAHLDRYKLNLLENIHNIENDETFTKKKTKLCDWCEYSMHCDGDLQ